MKRGTPEHPKTYDLAEQLSICRTHAVGILELLWHFTAKYAIQGDIGKHSDQRITEACGWLGKPQEFIQVLVAVGWLDEDEEHRLMVHAWAEQAKKYGASYAMWHNARGANIKCEKFPRSDYYMCFAGGKPCRALYAGVARSSGRGD